jgi:predicted ABC-type transport system involved in lysophospholipase L1 biosynthesis ATPase subunit
MATLIRAENIHKTYTVGKTSVPVLQGSTCSVNECESLAVVGISGAGKSTLLHILGGLDRPDQGKVLVDGQDFYELPGWRRTAVRAARIGFVFQSYHLLPEMDVLENVMLPAMARAKAGKYPLIRSRAKELLNMVGLGARADHTPMELSGGEQQRVALARALINDPAVVMADEPTGNLDVGTGGQVLDYLFSLTKERGHALILVTHDKQVAGCCDRMLNLTEGVLATA